MNEAEIMSAPLEHPIRVAVLGSSLVVMTPDTPTEPGEYSFPRWIQNGLLDRGRPAELDNHGVAGELTRTAVRRWETRVMASAPDVLVYGYGYYECIHALLPRWLERHVNARTWRPGPARSLYRRTLLRPPWKLLAQAQRIADIFLQDRLFGRKQRRVIADYELMIRRSRTYVPGRPLVLVLTLLGPGGRASGWFPGMQARIDSMNLALEDMVRRIDDPDVRLVQVGELASRASDEDPVPDGMHYSAPVRRALGDRIADEVHATWATRGR